MGFSTGLSFTKGANLLCSLGKQSVRVVAAKIDNTSGKFTSNISPL